jgi:predicted enzyme related to lactoylglutathione lyase
MIEIKEIAFTGYPITDVVRARGFYEQVLNLKPSTQFEHGGRHWIEYDIGHGTLAISNMSSEQWRASRDGPSIALEVVDFEAAINALRVARVTFIVEPTDTGVCWMAIVSDPDGNSLVIHKRHAK